MKTAKSPKHLCFQAFRGLGRCKFIIPLNNSRLKGDSLELRHFEGDIPGSGGEAAVVVTAAIALALLIALVPSRLGQLLSLGLQQLVEGFLYASAHKFLELPLDYFLV